MKTYSVDLRERLRRAIDVGLPQAEAACLFGVGPTTIKRWKRRRREMGALAPMPRPGRRPRISADHWSALEAQLRAAPDATLADHGVAWEQEQGVRVSVATTGGRRAASGWSGRLPATMGRTSRSSPR